MVSLAEDVSVVVAQLAEWSLLMPEVRGSHPAIGKFYNEPIEKTKLKEKESRKWLKGEKSQTERSGFDSRWNELFIFSKIVFSIS